MNENNLAYIALIVISGIYGIRMKLFLGKIYWKRMFITILVITIIVHFLVAGITTGISDEIISWAGLFIALWYPIGIISFLITFIITSLYVNYIKNRK